jgi:glycosyltransferase 2 family protein
VDGVAHPVRVTAPPRVAKGFRTRPVSVLRTVLRSRALRIAGSALGILLLLRTADLRGAAHDARVASPAWLAAGLALTALSFVAGVVQWGVLLRGAQSMVRWRSVASWQAQSVFACHVLPTAAAGDAVRAVNACRAAGNGTGIGSILGSRLAGSLGMAVWGLAGAITLRGTFGVPVLAAAAVYAACIGVAWILVLTTARPSIRAEPHRRDGLAARGARIVASLRDGCHAIRHRTGPIVVCVLVALAGWGVQLLALDAFAHALGAGVPPTLFAVALPISLVATWSPASVNGIGLREGVMAGILVHAGVSPDHAGAVSLVVDLQMLPFAVGGAIAWVATRRRTAPLQALPRPGARATV